MKIKYLVNKKTNEFAEIMSLGDSYGIFTSKNPTQALNSEVTFESYKEYINNAFGEVVNLIDYDIKEFDVIDSGEIGADIRNKLTSPLNLVALLEEFFKDEVGYANEKRTKLVEFIKKEMKQSKKSIEYLSNLL